MRFRDVLAALEAWAPGETALSFDNVGLLVGEPGTEVTGILTALDCTIDVVAEAVEQGCNLIVTHHPLIFSPVKQLTGATREQKLTMALLRAEIGLIAMHTNLDAAEGGVNDCLAAALGLTDVTVVPDTDGICRMGTLALPLEQEAFLSVVAGALELPALRYAGGSADGWIQRVAVGGGACGEYLTAVKKAGCDAFLTGEVKHHQFLDAGCLLLLEAGHFATESAVIPALTAFLQEKCTGVLPMVCRRSAADRDPASTYRGE